MAAKTSGSGGRSSLLVLIVAALVTAGVLLLPGSADDQAPVAGIPQPDTDGNALMVPSIGLDAPIRKLSLSPEGALDPPEDTDEVGRWDDSARAGARRGQTVVTGHTVHTGGGVMNRLGKMHKRQEIVVRDRGKLVLYRTTVVMTLSKAELAERAQRLFGQGRRGGRLVLVTCTDWNGTDYESNVVVLAKPVRRQGFGGSSDA